MNAAAPREAWRRALHVASGTFGLAWYLGASHRAITSSLVVVLVLAALLEWQRRRNAGLRAALARWSGGAIRPTEEGGVTGATLLAAGYTATWLLFAGPAAAPAVLVTAVADPVAAIVGVRVAHARGRKTWSGSAAACAAAFAVLAILRLEWRVCLAGALAAAIAERVSVRGLDNVAVPLVTAATLAAWP